MTLLVDTDVHVLHDHPLAAGGSLPPLDAPNYTPGAIDMVGRQVRSRGPSVVVGAVAGSVVGAMTNLGAAAGALAGAATGSLVSVMKCREVSDAPSARAQVDNAGLSEHVRVMEYNVHGGMGGPGQFFATPGRLDHLAATIWRERPDIVLLQELDHFATRSNYTDTLKQLTLRLRPTGAVMTPAIEKVNGRREGAGILTFNGYVITDARGLRIGDALGDSAIRRFRAACDAYSGMVSGKVHRPWVPFGGVIEYQPRVATDALVRTRAGHEIRVLSGHFSPPHHGIDEQRRQVDPIAATADTWSGPTIIGADFNVRDGSPEFQREHQVFAAVGLLEATTGAPANSDRIYASAHFDRTAARKVFPSPGEVQASDHAPVVVDLLLKSDHSGSEDGDAPPGVPDGASMPRPS